MSNKPTFNIDSIIESEDRNRGKVQYAKSDNVFSPQPGTYTVRMLAGDEGITTNPDFFFEQVAVHRLSGASTGYYACLKISSNERCPICNLVSKLYDSNVESNINVARDIKRYTRYMLNVVCREQAEKGVQIWKIGDKVKSQIIESIKSLRAEGQEWDITHPVTGRDYKLVVKQIPGQKWNEYTGSQFSFKTCPLATDPEVSSKLLAGRFDLTKQYTPNILTQTDLTEVLIAFLQENGMDELVKFVSKPSMSGARIVRPATIATPEAVHTESAQPVEEPTEEAPEQVQQEPTPAPTATQDNLKDRLRKAVSSLSGIGK